MRHRGWFYSCGGPEAITISNNKVRLCQFPFFLLISHNDQKYKVTFCDFRKGNISIKSVDLYSCFVGVPGQPPQSLLLKSGPVYHMNDYKGQK
jgi:hypothetical protein